ncbi:MAG TPA: hypothetical protein VLL49_07590 [Anaerolineales bacterium]|nr:hypothetical protein [Anaerolineales bacterium]
MTPVAMRLKDFLGHVPVAAVAYDVLRPGRPRTRYNLEQLKVRLPSAVQEVQPFAASSMIGRRIILFATLHYWIEQAAVLGLALRGMGYEVAIAYLPYGNWDKEIGQFDLRRQDRYTRRVLAPMQDLVSIISLLDVRPPQPFSAELDDWVQRAADYDVMYSLQTEEIDRSSALHRLRTARNRFAGRAALQLLRSSPPNAVLIPNGLVTELGMFYQAARHLNIPTTTYEFNDQREQIWLAQNDIVMHQNTDSLWAARGAVPLKAAQLEKIGAFEEARRGATTYGKGTRLWQDAPSQGGERLRARLGLDHRPVALLATNVLGDSLTLGRNVFASSMAEWIEKTVAYFVDRPEVQLVVRVHPGERLVKGPSIMRAIERAAPSMPTHIHVIGPTEDINTYDLIELAALGLVYTTTVGMEMAMRGVPVIVAGRSHYGSRGFTRDPSSWTEYFELLEQLLRDPVGARLSSEQVDAAWNYGYRFFFEYPFDFPWRLMHFWRDLDRWPLARVLSGEGAAAFGRTFQCLAGESIQW